MSVGLRILTSFGAVLLVVYLALRQFRSGGVQGTDIVEALAIAMTPLLLPGAAEMVLKAFGGQALPIFNQPEDRMTLFFGRAAVISGIAYGNFLALRRAGRTSAGRSRPFQRSSRAAQSVTISSKIAAAGRTLSRRPTTWPTK